MKRIGTLGLTAFAVLTLAFGFKAKATAQDVVQDDGPKQKMTILYPDQGIVVSGTGEDAVKYKGIVYVTVFPVTPDLIKKYGGGPVFSDEIQSNNGSSEFGSRTPRLPYGVYEVHFSMRQGDNLKTCIKKPVILSPENSPTLTAEFSNSKTLIIGGDYTFQQLEGAIGELARRVAALQAEVAALKGGKAAPAPAPTPAPDVPPAATAAPTK